MELVVESEKRTPSVNCHVPGIRAGSPQEDLVAVDVQTALRDMTATTTPYTCC